MNVFQHRNLAKFILTLKSSCFRSYFRSRFWRQASYGLLGLMVAVTLLLSPIKPTTAAVTQATITEIIDGNQIFIDNQQARLNAVAQAQQQVRTGRTRAQLKFNTGAIGRLSQNSQMIVAGQCFNIQSGTILVNGNVNGCTRSRRLSVRGTTYLVEVTAEDDTRIIVLEGEVAVTPVSMTKQGFPIPWFPRPSESRPNSDSDDESRPDSANTQSTPQNSNELNVSGETTEETFILKSGEQVSISRLGLRGPILQLTQSEFERLLTGPLFDGFLTELPGIGQIRDVFQQLFPGVSFPSIGVPGLSLPGGIRLPF